MIPIFSLPGPTSPCFKSAWMLDFLKMCLSPHPDCWGGVVRRRRRHRGLSKSGQIFKLLLQSSGFSFITVADAASLPCWPSFWKGRQKGFQKALDLFLPHRLEIDGECCQFRENSVWLPLLVLGTDIFPSSAPRRFLPFFPFLGSHLLSRKQGQNFPYEGSGGFLHSPHGWLQAPGYLPISNPPYSMALLLKKQKKEKKNLIATEAGRTGTYLRIQNIGFMFKFSSDTHSLTGACMRIGWCFISSPVKLKIAIKEMNNEE